jgi:hypothetical protein
MADLARENKDVDMELNALIWQGHVLDLLGRRDEAVACYRQVADRNSDESFSFDQYVLTFKASPYAKQRLAHPFIYLPNKTGD